MTVKRDAMRTGWLVAVAILLPAIGGAQPVIQTAAGGYHSLFLKSDGSLWAMGINGYGQLGDGTFSAASRPELIVASNVTAIAAGEYHSLFLKNDGSLWAMGANANGQLGDGTYNTANLPELILASNVTAIAAGGYHSLFLQSDGSLWAMGRDGNGQLGDGIYRLNAPYYGTNQPEQIVASNVTAIAAGEYHSLFLQSDGSLWAMGNNYNGQLGDGTFFDDTNQPEQIMAASNVVAIAAGIGHSLFIESDGSLWGMGANGSGQLGDGTYNNTNLPELIMASNVTAVAAGGYHSLFLQSDGSLWAMGQNWNGQLGDGTNGISIQTNRPEETVASGAVAISGGQLHSLFLKNDGSLWGMGDNQHGQLGDLYHPIVNRPEQILAAYNYLSSQWLSGVMQLSFVGVAGANYALDRAFNLSPADWVPQSTNAADAIGVLMFTNAPAVDTNNFWRIRSVP